MNGVELPFLEILENKFNLQICKNQIISTSDGTEKENSCVQSSH